MKKGLSQFESDFMNFLEKYYDKKFCEKKEKKIKELNNTGKPNTNLCNY